ncbi:MAG: PHP domain-containing protein [Ignavibacteriales bacterium]|nr:PHP domain-containing protein [Ignavibacteriales bacterium]
MEDEFFWTYADQELELFLLAPRAVKTFPCPAEKHPAGQPGALPGRAQDPEGLHRPPADVRAITFGRIPGLRIDAALSVPHQDQERALLLPVFSDAGLRSTTSAGWACRPTSSWHTSALGAFASAIDIRGDFSTMVPTMTIAADLHIHSTLSPCASLEMSPAAIVRRARELGLDVIAVTDHNSMDNGFHAPQAGREAGV